MTEKELLIICPFFIPVLTPRSIRWYHFSNYLAQKGFHIHILAADPKGLDFDLDNGLNNNIHNNIRIDYINRGIVKNFSSININLDLNKGPKNRIFLTLKRVLDEIICRLYYPDREMFWALKAYRHIAGHDGIGKYSCMITVSNPISSLLAGYLIRRRSNIKWVCDIGDPWTFNPFRKTIFIKRKIDEILEKRVVKMADKVVVTTEETKAFFADIYPAFKDKFVVISQGYDPKLYENAKGSPFVDKKRLNLLYTGRLYSKGRDGIELLYAVKGLGSHMGKINVLFAGRVNAKFERYVKGLKLGNAVNYIGNLPMNEVAGLQKSCDVLLQFGNDSKFQLPGKIFEYMGAGKPILAVYYNDNDIGKRMVEEGSLGITCSNERQRIKSALIRLIKYWEDGDLQRLRSSTQVPDCDWDSNAGLFCRLLKVYD